MIMDGHTNHRTTSRRRSAIGVLATMLVAAALVAVTAPSGAQPTNSLSGVWYGINQTDGSSPTVIVFGEGRTAMPVVFVDSITVGCPGGPEIVVGTARLAGDQIQFSNTTRYCADGQVLSNGRFRYAYDAAGRINDATPPPDRDPVEYQKVCPNATLGDFTDGIANYQVGTDAAETLTGTNANDVVDALGGNDTVRSGGGLDVVCGGGGRDTIRAGSGIDIVWADEGVDIVTGDAGIDIIFGGAGRDRLNGGADNDWLFGGPKDDTLIGARGNDTLDGGLGRDTLLGKGGRDSANGGAGRDRCVAETERRCER
jgi:Ca2+-binding RTX toxin-like protein